VYEIKNTTSRYPGVRKFYAHAKRMYGAVPDVEEPQVVIVEDSNAGFTFFEELCRRSGAKCVSAGGKGNVLIRGVRCPIVGRVCMDMTMVDISGVPDVEVGDLVTIWGKELPTEEQAKNAGTISYELMCSVSPRVPRVY
jgi:hypothetical protein